MKYVLLGNLSPEWAGKQSERTGKAKAKLDKLGIKIESIHYTQGYYDFVDIVDAPNEGRCSRSPSGTRPKVWDGSRVCRPSTQRPSKPPSRTRRAKRRVVLTAFLPTSCATSLARGAAFFPGG
ncbi:GYD domain-containing protein [Bradyrhizobium sp. RDT10]